MHKYKYLLIIFFLCTVHSVICYAKPLPHKSPKIITPSFVPDSEKGILPKRQDIRNSSDNTVQFAYFLQEITNFIDKDPGIYFYDYINPSTPEEAFTSERFNIYTKILLLRDIEKSPRERKAAQNIARFLAINYKTQKLPSYAHINNPHLPEPLYLSQLIQDAFQAVKEGKRNNLHALVNNYDLISSKDPSGNDLLTTAILYNRNNMVKFLISKGANVNSLNKDGETPIIAAAKMKNFEAANFLIKQGCNLRKLDKLGNSALDYAAEDKTSHVYLLIKNHLIKQKTKVKFRNKRSKNKFR